MKGVILQSMIVKSSRLSRTFVQFGLGLACIYAPLACSPAPAVRDEVRRVEEVFLTHRAEGDNIDSPAVWHGVQGQHWLLATAKLTDVVVVYDAVSGAALQRVGGPGPGPGRFNRPNGLSVVDDLLLVVERDNKRVQVLRLPDFQPLGEIGAKILRRPYGVTAFGAGEDGYVLYITDNYTTAGGGIPPDKELGERVHKFRFSVEGGKVHSKHMGAFGDTSGAGVLRQVESICADPANHHLLIADEAQLDIKIYTLDGHFTGKILGNGTFEYEPEGIALYRCGPDAGYWVTTDQDEHYNTFHIFNRTTLEHQGAFRGETMVDTDGVTLTQQAFGPFAGGAFFAVHDDGNVGAFSWASIAAALSLREDCTLQPSKP